MKQVVWTVVAFGLLGSGVKTARAGFINGSFATGDLTGWTVFTTANGTNGVDPVTGTPLPAVASFDTTGTGAQNSAHFNVGSNILFQEEGGGIFQDVNVTAGTYQVSGAFASQNDPDGQNNTDAGTFSLLVDGVVVQSFNLGGFANPHDIIRGNWSASVDLKAGSHEFSFEITRQFFSTGDQTPQEYLTNLSLTGGSVPEPASVCLLGIGFGGLIGYRRLRRRIA
jgi:hypothetical protein